jgi:hypothetical protein
VISATAEEEGFSRSEESSTTMNEEFEITDIVSGKQLDFSSATALQKGLKIVKVFAPLNSTVMFVHLY